MANLETRGRDPLSEMNYLRARIVETTGRAEIEVLILKVVRRLDEYPSFLGPQKHFVFPFQAER